MAASSCGTRSAGRSSPPTAAIRARVARLGLGGVDFLGPRDDVPALMAAADLLVLPSDFEGLPLVVLEAMAARLPVVATRIGGVVEALGPDHPWLVPPGDARALAAALAAALDDPAARAATAASTSSTAAAVSQREVRSIVRIGKPHGASDRGVGVCEADPECADDNAGSAATIEACGGVLENVVPDGDGRPTRRYWIG